MYLLHVSIFYICLLYQLSLFSSFASFSSSSSSSPPHPLPLPPPSISFPPGCRSLFLRAKFTFRYRARAGWARLGNPPMLTWTFPKRYLRCPSTAQYSPVQPSTAQYFLVNVQVKWLILPLCTVPIVRCLLSQACLAPSSKLKNHGNFFI